MTTLVNKQPIQRRDREMLEAAKREAAAREMQRRQREAEEQARLDQLKREHQRNI